MNCLVQIRRDHGRTRRRNYFRQAQKKRSADKMDSDRCKRHREEVPRSERVLPRKQLELGRSFSGNVYRRHKFDNR